MLLGDGDVLVLGVIRPNLFRPPLGFDLELHELEHFSGSRSVRDLKIVGGNIEVSVLKYFLLRNGSRYSHARIVRK